MSAHKLAITGFVLDQAIAWLLVTGNFSGIHSNAYFGEVQGPGGWAVVAIFLSIGFYCAQKNHKLFPGLFFVTAGFASNVLSKVIYGRFIDYIPTGFSYINTADLLVGIGCILLIRAILTWQQQS